MNTERLSLFLIAAAFILVGCNRNSDDNFAQKEALSTDSLVLASDTITLGNSIQIQTYHPLKNSCEAFYGFDIKGTPFEKQFQAYAYNTGLACGSAEEFQHSLLFTPKASGTYLLKFWKTQSEWTETTVVVLPSISSPAL